MGKTIKIHTYPRSIVALLLYSRTAPPSYGRHTNSGALSLRIARVCDLTTCGNVFLQPVTVQLQPIAEHHIALPRIFNC